MNAVPVLLASLCVFCTMICYAVNPVRECYAFESTYHLDRACECIVYQSYGRSQGTFTSPNFPQVYPPNVNCILYTFIGDLDEIVELTFLEFDLKVPITNKCTDFLKFFLDLNRPEVNEHHAWKYELCGNISMIQKVHYSSQRSLILEFHTDSFQGNHTGFRGRFKFIEKSQFEIVGGDKRWGAECTYDFYSAQISPAKNAGDMLRFFSPGYPQNYPPGSYCQYIFYANDNERVRVTFQNIQLESIDGSCSDSPDTIIVRDGGNKKDAVIAQYCNTLNSEQVISSGENLYIEFMVDDKKQRQGFAATYSFIPADQLTQLKPSRDTTVRPEDTIMGHNTHKPGNVPYFAPTVPTTRNYNSKTDVDVVPNKPMTDCHYVFASTSSTNGTFTSPNYPSPYPPGKQCRYTFQGEGKERVQITFEVLDLHYVHGNPEDPYDCEDVDSVVILVTIGGTDMEIGVYCGTKLPPLLMSNNNRMDIILTTHEASQSRGFLAHYKFVRNFGINHGEPLSDLACGFRYDSKFSQNGTFHSPNYPGLYPRDTECHYLFYGEGKEQVSITFPYFDVEGIEPGCLQDTQSDYVEFSNFYVKLKDRKMDRLCGSSEDNKKKMVQSDGNFFRVTFKSNNVYDATGFQAYYQFRTTKRSFAETLPRNNRNNSSPNLVLPSLVNVILLFVFSLSFNTAYYFHR